MSSSISILGLLIQQLLRGTKLGHLLTPELYRYNEYLTYYNIFIKIRLFVFFLFFLDLQTTYWTKYLYQSCCSSNNDERF